MSLDEIPQNVLPVWMKILIIAAALPLFSFFKLMELCPPYSQATVFLWIYPFFTALCAVLEWRVWKQRPEITWVLLIVEILTHGAMWILVDPSLLLP